MKSDNKKKCGLSAKEMTTDKTKNLAIKKKTYVMVPNLHFQHEKNILSYSRLRLFWINLVCLKAKMTSQSKILLS